MENTALTSLLLLDECYPILGLPKVRQPHPLFVRQASWDNSPPGFVVRRPKSLPCVPHWHLQFLRRSHCRWRAVGSPRWNVPADDTVILFAPHFEYEMENIGPGDRCTWIINFDAPSLSRWLTRFGLKAPLGVSPEKDSSFERDFQFLYEELRGGHAASLPMANSLAVQILCNMVRCLIPAPENPPANSPQLRSRKGWAQWLHHWLLKTRGVKSSIVSFARNHHMQPYELSRCYKEQFGECPNKTQVRLRMSEAAILVSRTQLSIKDVGSKLGYEASSSFIRAFVTHHGVSPTQFRERMRRKGKTKTMAPPRTAAAAKKVRP